MRPVPMHSEYRWVWYAKSYGTEYFRCVICKEMSDGAGHIVEDVSNQLGQCYYACETCGNALRI
jgi:hypothetical protein